MLSLLPPLSPPLPHKGGGSRPSSRRTRALLARSKKDSLCSHSMLRNASIIDDHAPRDAADRDRDGGLAAVDVDHRDVVAEAVRHKHGALVARERDTPGALADQNVA